MTENEIGKIIFEVVFALHQKIGGGLLESAYQAIIVHEIQKRGLTVQCEVPIAIIWDDVNLDAAFRADIIVEGKVIIELKSIEMLLPVHKKQLLTYLRLTGLRLGLLINMGRELLKDNFIRIANGMPDE